MFYKNNTWKYTVVTLQMTWVKQMGLLRSSDDGDGTVVIQNVKVNDIAKDVTQPNELNQDCSSLIALI